MEERRKKTAFATSNEGQIFLAETLKNLGRTKVGVSMEGRTR